jgi:hypothetical protein
MGCSDDTLGESYKAWREAKDNEKLETLRKLGVLPPDRSTDIMLAGIALYYAMYHTRKEDMEWMKTTPGKVVRAYIQMGTALGTATSGKEG